MKSFWRIGLTLCAATVVAVTGAAAQERNPASDWSAGVRPGDPQRTAEGMHELTSCIAQTMRRRSIALLSMPFPSAEASAEVQKLMDDGNGCLDLFRVRFRASLLRGGLFEAFYRRDFPRADGPRRRATFVPRASELTATDTRRQTNCVVARDGARSDALIRTYPGTDPERSALEPLMLAIRACAQETGVSIPEIRLFRSALAESLYLSRAGETVQTTVDGE